MDIDLSAVAAVMAATVTPFVSYWAARRGALIAAKSAASTCAMDAFVRARLDTYRDFEQVFSQWVLHGMTGSAAAIYSAANAVSLVCSDNTRDKLSPLTQDLHTMECTGNLDRDKFTMLHTALLLAMQEDLRTFPVPTPEMPKAKKKWFSR